MQAHQADATPAEDADAVAAARAAAAQGARVAEAAAALLRTELRLARSSALWLLGLALLLVVLCVGVWLATSAAIAVGIQQLTGNLFYGVGCVALANLLGAAIVAKAMRTCWRDLGLPRTRRLLARIGQVRS
jgi:hypothetical protein